MVRFHYSNDTQVEVISEHQLGIKLALSCDLTWVVPSTPWCLHSEQMMGCLFIEDTGDQEAYLVDPDQCDPLYLKLGPWGRCMDL